MDIKQVANQAGKAIGERKLAGLDNPSPAAKAMARAGAVAAARAALARMEAGEDPAAVYQDITGQPLPSGELRQVGAGSSQPATGSDELRARSCMDRIRSGLADTAQAWCEAIEHEHWKVLGYPSWEACRDGELAEVKFTVAARQQIARMLREAGMSTRAIAGAVGASQATVVGDLAPEEISDQNLITPHQSVTGGDMKVYPPRRGKPSAHSVDKGLDAAPPPITQSNKSKIQKPRKSDEEQQRAEFEHFVEVFAGWPREWRDEFIATVLDARLHRVEPG